MNFLKAGIVLFSIGAAIAFSHRCGAAEPAQVLQLWPGNAPGEPATSAREEDTTKEDGRLVAGKRVIRLGHVSKPTITLFRPASTVPATGTAVIVCPGGGYSILAMDLEGTEVCEWLNSLGITAVLLKYRVPKLEGEEGHIRPLQDAQRAMGLVRHHAKDWGVNATQIGILGFSAGGHLAASLSNNYQRRRYTRIDKADDESCRPDFALLIYPGLMVAKDKNELGPELKLSDQTPPTFLAMAADDPIRVENALFYALELRKFKVPMELHVYPVGGHGYGLRPNSEAMVTTWPDRAADWMRSQKLLTSKAR